MTETKERWNVSIHMGEEIRDYHNKNPHLPVSRLVRRACERWMECQGSYAGFFGKSDLKKLAAAATKENFFAMNEEDTWEVLRDLCDLSGVDFEQAEENIHSPWVLFLEMDRIEEEFVSQNYEA